MGFTTAIFQGVNTVGQFASQQYQARNLDRQATFDSDVAQMQSVDAIARGNYEAGRRTTAGKQLIGAQRTAAGASGVDPNSGSAAALQVDEAKYSALDAITIKNNAARVAWGYTAQSALNQSALKNEADQLRTGSYSTLLTGGANLARYGLSRRGTTVPTTKPTEKPDPITTQWWNGGGY